MPASSVRRSPSIRECFSERFVTRGVAQTDTLRHDCVDFGLGWSTGKRVCPNLSQRRAVAATGMHVTFPAHFRPFDLGNRALLRLESSPAKALETFLAQ